MPYPDLPPLAKGRVAYYGTLRIGKGDFKGTYDVRANAYQQVFDGTLGTDIIGIHSNLKKGPQWTGTFKRGEGSDSLFLRDGSGNLVYKFYGNYRDFTKGGAKKTRRSSSPTRKALSSRRSRGYTRRHRGSRS